MKEGTKVTKRLRATQEVRLEDPRLHVLASPTKAKDARNGAVVLAFREALVEAAGTSRTTPVTLKPLKQKVADQLYLEYENTARLLVPYIQHHRKVQDEQPSVPTTNAQDPMAVILVGNFLDGYKLVGPFKDWDTAAQFDGTCNDPSYNPEDHTTWIVTLTAPPKPDLTTTREAVERTHS